MRILVTGVIGFIGSHFVKQVLTNWPNAHVTGFGRYSDVSNCRRLTMIPPNYLNRFKLVYGDLSDSNVVSGICEHIDVVVNFAAKTFVDHSLKDDKPFIASNIIGTINLMHDAMRYGVKTFIQVSTDEVYGQILTGSYKEDDLLNPRNPYSWSKACADLYAIQLFHSRKFPVIITRTENNFGPWQHRQKVLPTFTRCAMSNQKLPVYGDGLHVRCWLHVEEHCRAIMHLINKGTPGEVYHVAGEDELTNLELARIVLHTLGKPGDQIQHIDDHNIRPGHDRRYALDCTKLKNTGFTIKQNLRRSLADTIIWYRDNPTWTM